MVGRGVCFVLNASERFAVENWLPQSFCNFPQQVICRNERNFEFLIQNVSFQILILVHEVRITNQIMYLYPSSDEARVHILQQLYAWQAVVTSQTRLQSTRYQVG